MPDLTDADLAALREALEAATPGPWEGSGGLTTAARVPYRFEWLPADLNNEQYSWNQECVDSALMALARNHLPALLARLDAAEAERDRLKAAVSAWLAECEPPYAGGNVGLSGAAWRRLTELYHYAAALAPQEAP